MKRRRVAEALVIIGVLLAVVVGCASPVTQPKAVPPNPVAAPSPTTSSATLAPGISQHIAQLLSSAVVIPRLANVPGYERSCKAGKGCVFGPAWADTEHTGCDTRNRVLGAQLTDVVFKPGTRNCKVTAGILQDPYSGATLVFGGPARDAIEIDHVFALKRAWDAGAAQWSAARRLEFANDTKNLLAVSAAENGRKSDSGPDEWLPTNRQFTCRFIEIYLGVAVKYQLAVTATDKSVAESNCPP